MNVLVVHALWLWGELLGRPGKAPTPDEVVRAGARAAALLPGLVAALGDGYDRVLVAVDGSEPWRRELGPEATERHVRWPAPAWRPFADVVETLERDGARVVVAEPWPPGTFLPLGEGGVSLAGKRGSGRDVIATIARAWRRETPDEGTLTIASGRSSVAGLVHDELGVELLRDVRQRGESWEWVREREADVRARLGYDPCMVAEVKALESLPGIDPVTALALVRAHQGSALRAVEMACMVAPGERLPGTMARPMAALRAAGADGGAGIRRALALVGVRDDVPIDVGALLHPPKGNTVMPMSDANHETLRTILGARPGESTLDAGRRVVREEGAIVERAMNLVDQIEKQTAIANTALRALDKDTPQDDRVISIASLEALGSLPPGNCDAFKHRSYMAASGWRTALALAVQYGARASERAAREALRALGVDP